MPKTNYQINNDLSFNNYKMTVDKSAESVTLNTMTINASDIGAIIEMLRSAKKVLKKNAKTA